MMIPALPAATQRIALEKKFVLGFFGLLAAGCVAVYLLSAQRASLPVAVVVIGSCVGVLGSGIAHYLLFEPLHRLVVTAEAIGSGEFRKCLRFDRHDEIGSLAHAMDSMCDQLQAAQRASEAHIAALEQLRHSDRVATLGRLASSVAHELGNPLNVIELRAQLIASGDAGAPELAQHNAAVILEQTRRMTRIIAEILTFARTKPARIKHFDLVSVMRSAVALSAHTSKKYRTSLVLDVPEAGVEMDGDADKLLQVFVNLVINGIEAMPHGGTLCVSTRQELRAALDDPQGAQRHYVRVDVTDHGVGIAESLIGEVFKAFYSTKSAAGGTGLGLSVAQGIVHEHAGWISVTSEPGRGSTFRVYLPKQGLQDGGADADS